MVSLERTILADEEEMERLHAWNVPAKKAMELQSTLREQLVLNWDGGKVKTVAGVDVHYEGRSAFAAIVVLTYPELKPCSCKIGVAPIGFPYIPGLLAFREGPAVLAAWHLLAELPDLVMFDAQGIAHPRGLGLASHMGLWLDRPSIGVAKARLFGRHASPKPRRGDRAELWDERDPDRLMGMVVRTQDNVSPLYVSPGHRIDVPSSVEFVLHCCTKYRLPEPIRWAHFMARGGSPARGPSQSEG